MAFTKTTIIEQIIEKYNCSPARAREIVETMLEIIKQTLSSGEDIMISGFGKFQVNEKAPRKGRNPATGKDMMLGRRRVVTFKCAGRLREEINERQNRSL